MSSQYKNEYEKTKHMMRTIDLVNGAIEFIRVTIPYERAKELQDHLEANAFMFDPDHVNDRLGKGEAEPYQAMLNSKAQSIANVLEVVTTDTFDWERALRRDSEDPE